MRAYRLAVMLFAGLFVLLGFAILVRTALAGGGIGFLFGALFVALGSGRIYLQLRR